jgi:hypothetical protein
MHQAVGWFDCAPSGCVIAPRPELEKAWLFGQRSWPPPALIRPQPSPRAVGGAIVCLNMESGLALDVGLDVAEIVRI